MFGRLGSLFSSTLLVPLTGVEIHSGYRFHSPPVCQPACREGEILGGGPERLSNCFCKQSGAGHHPTPLYASHRCLRKTAVRGRKPAQRQSGLSRPNSAGADLFSIIQRHKAIFKEFLSARLKIPLHINREKRGLLSVFSRDFPFRLKHGFRYPKYGGFPVPLKRGYFPGR